eukprot:1300085-Alexandrium_andersonii.AAC.1
MDAPQQIAKDALAIAGNEPIPQRQRQESHRGGEGGPQAALAGPLRPELQEGPRKPSRGSTGTRPAPQPRRAE